MKNAIKSGGKIWKRRSKNLKSGKIQCPTCGEWKRVIKFIDKHFNELYVCKNCKEESPKPKKKAKPKKVKPTFPSDCAHKAFFGTCKFPSNCIGCYYHPVKKIALMLKHGDDPKKTAKDNWFYGNKAQARKSLALLDDIKSGRGLKKGGNRHRFKYARVKNEDDDE